METPTLEHIEEQLRHVSPEKLAAVAQFISSHKRSVMTSRHSSRGARMSDGGATCRRGASRRQHSCCSSGLKRRPLW